MKRDLLIIAGLLTITAAAYSGLAGCGFINFDDPVYIVGNRHVTGGLSWTNIRWACTTFHAGNYIPLTWLSLMLDASLFGAGPQGFHWVNLAFHAANVVLVFLWFRAATGDVWRSALVAAIFGVHPLRVESVAWVVERKDVLTAFFALLAMSAYLRFVRTLRWRWYAALLVLFAATLLAKQTLATLPFLLLLLDYWPLGRWIRGPAPFDALRASGPRRTMPQLIVEKLPLLLMVAAIALVTVKAQATAGSVAGLKDVPLAERLANAPISYVRYLGKMVWFGHLAVFYPRHAWSAVQVVTASALLAAISAVALAKRRSSPWLSVGWFWFLGVLVPMIGLVQFASQSMADRFTYISGIGVLVMVIWSIPAAIARRMPLLTAAAAATVLGILCGFTLVQLGYWRDSVTIFTHDIEVAGSNTTAEINLGFSLTEAGDYAAAIAHLQSAIRLAPRDAVAHYDLANALIKERRSLEAEHESRIAIQLDPHFAQAYNACGAALMLAGKLDEAADQFRSALALEPGLVAAQHNLAAIRASKERRMRDN